MLELINRARLDPAQEARRLGIGLNDGLASGAISTAPKQALAHNSALGLAAERHSQWMLDADTFNHTGKDGSQPVARIKAAGYDLTSPWRTGENIALAGSSAGVDLNAMIAEQHDGLMRSAGHRRNLLDTTFREIGIGQVKGDYTSRGTVIKASSVTQDFAVSGTAHFVTGVAYADRNGDGFYSIGEGTGKVTFTVGSRSMTTDSVGGYSLAAGSAADTLVSVTSATGKVGKVRVDLSDGNAKLDLVNGDTLYSSVDLTLVSGIAKATLLGAGQLSLTGGGGADTLTGNRVANVISGGGGNDAIRGGAGNDRLYGGSGDDRIWGEDGNDSIWGGTGNDQIAGGAGNDTLNGEAGQDRIWGGAGNDTIRGGADNDELRGEDGDDQIWGGTGSDTIWGGNGNDAVNGEDGDDLLAGDAGNDRIWGGAGNDQIWGGTGNDAAIGDAGNDQIRGGAGDDRLYGAAGNDLIWGEAGADRLDGGTGNDGLSGGSGADVYVFADGYDKDTIYGFSTAEGDRVALDRDLWSGNLTARQVVERHDSIVGGSLVLDFGDGDTLTFKDFTDAAALIGLLDFF